MKHWLEPSQVHVPEVLRQAVGGEPLVTQLLVQRGITTPEAAARFFDPDRYQPCSPFDFPGMEAAVDRLERAIRRGERICVWGDFDADGQTATSTLVSTLRDLKAQVSYHIPVRARESHGVNLPMLREVISQGAQLIVTCDTGITAFEAVEYACQQGVDFIITDHHELPEILPRAVAAIDSRLLPAAHPLATLPGVGVAYKLSEALYQRFRREGEEEKLVDLAAIGIVADLAEQVNDARNLVQKGLRALHDPQRPAFKALLEAAEVNPSRLNETHIGFSLAPCLNALGRLDDANISVEFFTSQNITSARVTAAMLEGLNSKRQLLTKQVLQAAEAELEKEPALLDDPILVLAHPNWPAGVVGIVASHLVERYNRPVILLANPPGQPAHGSARSVEGCDINAAIATQKALLSNFGGHPMAAGLALESDKIQEFKRGLFQAVRQMGCPTQPTANLQIDGYLSLPDLTLERVEDFRRLAPFGPGNPSLNFAARNLSIASVSEFGRNKEHLQITVADEQGNNRKVTWWQGEKQELPEGRFDLAFNVEPTDFHGTDQVELLWVDARPVEDHAPLILPISKFEVIDSRDQAYPLASLKKLLQKNSLQVWVEADGKTLLEQAGIDGSPRISLLPGETLAIWTTPPGPKELKAVLADVSPQAIYLYGVDPSTGDANAFLTHLVGLVNYALKHDRQEVKLIDLAAATAQRESTVHKGLEWLVGKGYILFEEQPEGQVKLLPGTRQAVDTQQVMGELQHLLDETAAFRRYFHRATLESLIELVNGKSIIG